MKMIVLVALLAAAGCSKKSSVCEGPISKGMDSFASAQKGRASTPEVQQSTLTMVGKLKGALVQRCTQDKWSPEALACFAAVSSPKDVGGCDDKLTPEQRTKMHADVMQAMTGSRMPRAMPGHPPMLSGSSGSAAAPAAGSAAAPAAGSAAPAAGSAAAPAAGSAAPAAGSAAPAAGSNAT